MATSLVSDMIFCRCVCTYYAYKYIIFLYSRLPLLVELGIRKHGWNNARAVKRRVGEVGADDTAYTGNQKLD